MVFAGIRLRDIPSIYRNHTYFLWGMFDDAYVWFLHGGALFGSRRAFGLPVGRNRVYRLRPGVLLPPKQGKGKEAENG